MFGVAWRSHYQCLRLVGLELNDLASQAQVAVFALLLMIIA